MHIGREAAKEESAALEELRISSWLEGRELAGLSGKR